MQRMGQSPFLCHLKGLDIDLQESTVDEIETLLLTAIFSSQE